MVRRDLAVIIINCLICTCTCATYSWEMFPWDTKVQILLLLMRFACTVRWTITHNWRCPSKLLWGFSAHTRTTWECQSLSAEKHCCVLCHLLERQKMWRLKCEEAKFDILTCWICCKAAAPVGRKCSFHILALLSWERERDEKACS